MGDPFIVRKIPDSKLPSRNKIFKFSIEKNFNKKGKLKAHPKDKIRKFSFLFKISLENGIR